MTVKGLKWNETGDVDGSLNELLYETSVDGKVQATGSVNLTELGSRELLQEVEVGTIKVNDRGTHCISVKLTVDSSESSAGDDYEGELHFPNVSCSGARYFDA